MTGVSVRETLERALVRIAEQQQQTLGWIRKHGIVFDEAPGTDPSNWQHVAFSIYTDLCEVDVIARTALDEFAAAPAPTDTLAYEERVEYERRILDESERRIAAEEALAAALSDTPDATLAPGSLEGGADAATDVAGLREALRTLCGEAEMFSRTYGSSSSQHRIERAIRTARAELLASASAGEPE